MKNVVFSIALLVGCSLAAQTSQKPPKEEMRKERIKEWSPEQHATLRTKKMTLHLDLSEEQQNKVYNLELKNAKNRKALKDKQVKKQEVSSEELFNRKNEQLTQKIALKKEYQNILTKEQFEKWEKTVSRKKKKRKHNKEKRG